MSSSPRLRFPEVVILYASVSADHSAKGKTDELMGMFEGARRGCARNEHACTRARLSVGVGVARNAARCA